MNQIQSTRQTPWGAIASLVTALLYGVSPIDLIPDIIPLLGLMDDAGVIATLVVVALVLRRRTRNQARPALPSR